MSKSWEGTIFRIHLVICESVINSSELKTLTEEWSSHSSRGKVHRFVTADDDEGGLRFLSQSIQLAIERFQVPSTSRP
jgi:hypothetical protein